MAQLLTSNCLQLFFWLQGTEAYNVLLRLLGASIAPGVVVFGKVDLPELLKVEPHCTIGKNAILKCATLGLRGGRPVLSLGAIHIRHHAAVGDQCSLFGGCLVPPFSEIEANTDVHWGNDANFARSPETTWTHDVRYGALFVQSALPLLLVAGALFGSLYGATVLWFEALLRREALNPRFGLAPPVTVVLFVVAMHAFQLLVPTLLFVVAQRLIGAPRLDTPTQTEWLTVGSWGFYRHVTLRQAVVHLLGHATFALQSCRLPAAILRAAGARIGPRTIVFNYDYATELSVPLLLLSIGADTLVTTHVQLGVGRYRCGRWSIGHVHIGDGCLIGNNAILDARSEGVALPDKTWVGALSDVTQESLESIPKAKSDIGAVVLGIPAKSTPVAPSTDLAESGPRIPVFGPTLVSLLWVLLLPFLCPAVPEMLAGIAILFYYLPALQAPAGTEFLVWWGLCSAVVLGVLLWSILIYVVAGRLAGAVAVYSGSELPIFSRRWFVFHWFDMLLIRFMQQVLGPSSPRSCLCIPRDPTPPAHACPADCLHAASQSEGTESRSKTCPNPEVSVGSLVSRAVCSSPPKRMQFATLATASRGAAISH